MIQREVTYLVDDVSRLRDRVSKLQNHFGQANKDIDQILISSDKISSRGRKIETLDFDREAEKLLKAKNNSDEQEQNNKEDQPKLLAGE